MSTSSASSSYWTFVSGDMEPTHPLHNVISGMIDDLTDDLVIIRYAIQHSVTPQEDETVQLRDKIEQRLAEHFYDSSREDVQRMTSLIEFKTWPSFYGVPPEALHINGKGIGDTLLILLRPLKLPTPPEIIEEKRRIIKKVKVHQDSKHSIKALSRLHSVKARRKL